MKKILTTFFTVAFAVVSFAADDKQAIAKDMAQLQGDWSMVSGTTDGFPIPPQMVSNSKRVCKGDELTVIVGGQLIMKAKIALDASKKPKTMDYDVTAGPNKGKKLSGIYELDGDTFKSCFAAPGAERPTDFTSKSGEKQTLTVWKRNKATPKAEQK
jgi:uncharacterized protein (TIGR03067 family)